MADKELTLTVKINAETGQLEVVGQKLSGLGDSAKKTKESFTGLTGQAGTLLKTMLPFATAAGAVAFFASAVKGAEEQNEAFRRLRFTIESSGGVWEQNRKAVEDWTKAISASTRFTDGQAIEALDKFARVTGSVGQAQAAAKLAMDLSVASGKSLQETTGMVTDLLNGQERALMAVKREFGATVGSVDSTQEALDRLAGKFSGVAEKAGGMTDQAAKVRNQYEQLKDQLGNALIPVLVRFLDAILNVRRDFDIFIESTWGGMRKLWEVAKGTAAALGSLGKGDIIGAKAAIDDTVKDLNTLEQITAVKIGMIQQTHTAAVTTGTTERLAVTQEARDKEVAEQKEAADKQIAIKEEASQKIAQMESDLDMRIVQLGDETYSKKIKLIDMEVQKRKQAAQQVKATEKELATFLQTLADWEKAEKAKTAEEARKLKQQQMLGTIDYAVQTLQTLNALDDKGSAAQRTRAKALLALQQAVAIGWIWVNATKLGGWGTALAAAQTGLAVAAFAQQYKAIDESGRSESSGIADVRISDPIPGITPTPTGDMPGGGGSGGTVYSGGSSSGGGGGGGNVINVGGIVVNFDVDKLSTDNVDAVLLRLYERLRQATIEAVQFAVASKNLADKNSTLAV